MQNNIFSGDSRPLNLIVLDEVTSTNDYLKSQLSKFKPLPEFTAIMARKQTNGRGQRDNTWLSAPNVNITFSLLLYPVFLKLRDHFILNMCVSLGIIDWFHSLQIDAKIKWPNDLMINDKKVTGILIENKSNSKGIKESIIGIGINANQEEFPGEIAEKASSIFRETNYTVPSLENSCREIINYITKRYIALEKQEISHENLLAEYNENLFLRNQTSKYRAGDEIFEAKILRVDEDGKLYLETNDGVTTFYFKEVEFLLQ
ncbi:biotin--[acetyl-CoA-carboxylase] ligase [Sphingobacteruim zhuxiongii]|uniref:biotin--[acetyl-CoA-carboxylase] ligase n=1 Tax=Sphingobacterium zhuxiongii TaxID=2662364 RepID=UPI001365523E|nr:MULTISPECIES: biotin--[acetyl-CoA-carboxylase] ligase [unclassified Sphingobacterium]